jgi:hypothetical protein
MAESWDNKTKATVQKIPLLTVCQLTFSCHAQQARDSSAVAEQQLLSTCCCLYAGECRT